MCLVILVWLWRPRFRLGPRVSEVRGEFVRGEVVQCIDATGRPVAQGLVNYSDTELRSIRGLPSDRYNQVLSIEAEPEVIHRDNLVLL